MKYEGFYTAAVGIGSGVIVAGTLVAGVATWLERLGSIRARYSAFGFYLVWLVAVGASIFLPLATLGGLLHDTVGLRVVVGVLVALEVLLLFAAITVTYSRIDPSAGSRPTTHDPL